MALLLPKVCKGQTVLWSDGPGSTQEPAIVLKVAGDSIGISLHTEHYKDHVLKTGVRYQHDPDLATKPITSGVWDFTDRDKELNKLLELLDEGKTRKGS